VSKGAIVSLVLTGALLLATGSSGAWAAEAPLTADEVVRHALSHHPEAAAAHAAIEVARAERRSVGLWSANPSVEAQLGADYVYAQGTQPLSLTGEGWSARRAASLEAEAATSSARRADLVVAAAAREAWARAAAADRQAALAEELLALAGRLRQIVEAYAAADEASVLEVNLARVAEARAVAEALALRGEAAQRRQQLAAFHPDVLAAELGEPEDALPAGPLAEPSERSDVAAARLDVDAARAALRRERAAAVPPVGLGAWVQREGQTLSAGPYLEAEVPLFTFRQGEVARARARLEVAEAERARVEQVALAEQQTTRALVEVAQTGIERIEGVEEAARAALVAVDRGFEAGELDLSTAVLLRTEVFDGWIASLDARAAAVQAGLLDLLAHEDVALLGGAP
jgi:cobalt-zinc-cadmium efflux system outer membrane protein